VIWLFVACSFVAARLLLKVHHAVLSERGVQESPTHGIVYFDGVTRSLLLLVVTIKLTEGRSCRRFFSEYINKD
jgi:hypothetical protein